MLRRRRCQRCSSRSAGAARATRPYKRSVPSAGCPAAWPCSVAPRFRHYRWRDRRIPVRWRCVADRCGTFIIGEIATWPNKSDSGEVLLYRRDGLQVHYLNQLQHGDAGSSGNHLPLTNSCNGGTPVARRSGTGQLQRGKRITAGANYSPMACSCSGCRDGRFWRSPRDRRRRWSIPGGIWRGWCFPA